MELGRLIRKAFVPKPGCVFLDADYSQIELRVLAHMSGDENLIEAYREAEDIHRMTASKVFHVPLEEVTPLQRRNAKAVNFGIVYGISSFGLGQDLGISRKGKLFIFYLAYLPSLLLALVVVIRLQVVIQRPKQLNKYLHRLIVLHRQLKSQKVPNKRNRLQPLQQKKVPLLYNLNHLANPNLPLKLLTKAELLKSKTA